MLASSERDGAHSQNDLRSRVMSPAGKTRDQLTEPSDVSASVHPGSAEPVSPAIVVLPIYPALRPYSRPLDPFQPCGIYRLPFKATPRLPWWQICHRSALQTPLARHDGPVEMIARPLMMEVRTPPLWPQSVLSSIVIAWVLRRSGIGYFRCLHAPS